MLVEQNNGSGGPGSNNNSPINISEFTESPTKRNLRSGSRSITNAPAKKQKACPPKRNASKKANKKPDDDEPRSKKRRSSRNQKKGSKGRYGDC